MKNCSNCKYYKQGDVFGICTNEKSKKQNKEYTLKSDKCKCCEETNVEGKTYFN